ncbi:hypothetical protein PRK78_005094 [Emydomyces testavorans]|uniref:Nibrin second BRCT domain-containing protein n=1 Tax=Emydomyces testavorans TaxID=2070801 RepID=A0AAF0DLE1_9EURO|nr:hypothetical protein PRK78_005094 [Emydomyces testavorans]
MDVKLRWLSQVHIHARSKLIVADQKSKHGTVVDGENIKGKTKELGVRDEHTIFLGRYPHSLKIKWWPVVLSFSFTAEEAKTEDSLTHAQSRLEDLDIKTVLPYIVDKTTHVVQKERFTAKGLQALINGKYIVDPSYIEEIVYAATSTDLEREEALCPLEQDFDAAWPDPVARLPSRGSEATDLPDSAYKPQPERLNVFEGYTFVFCDSTRLEELQDPITNGHGKALLCRVEPEKTTVQEIVDYVTNASGNKGLARDVDGSGGVLVVRSGREQNAEWFEHIESEVSRLTGQQLVDRADFLDAILRNEASILYKPLAISEPIAESQVHTMKQAEQLSTSQPAAATGAATTAVEMQKKSRPLKRLRTQTYVPKFKNFDDGFDMESIPAHTIEAEDVSGELFQPAAFDSLPDQPLQESQMLDDDDGVSELLPAATAMRKHFNGRARRVTSPPPEPERKVKKPKLDVMEAARKRREAEDRAAMMRREEEEAAAIVDGMDLSRIQNLVIIEEMPVHEKVRQEQPSNGSNDRWDERWNGRKNFKKFRRKGDGGVQHRVQAVIIPVEEVKKKDFGIGDEYWSYNNSARTERNQSVVQESNDTMLTSQPVSQQADSTPAAGANKRSRVRDSDSEDGLRFRFRRKKKR